MIELQNMTAETVLCLFVEPRTRRRLGNRAFCVAGVEQFTARHSYCINVVYFQKSA